MHSGKSLTLTSLLAIFLLLFPVPAFPAVVKVVLYPDSAYVTETAKVKLAADQGRLKKAVLTLPASADPQTIVILSGNPPLVLKDQQYRKADHTGLAVSDERTRKLARLKEERASQRAALYSAEAQIQFWQSQTKTKAKTPQDAVNLASTIARNTKKAWQEKAALEMQLENTDRKIGELQQELKQADKQRLASWEVTAWFSDTNAKEAVLRYAYILADCGWQSIYRLNALSREKTIAFSREAEVWQNSGRDWLGVEMVLSSAKAPPQANDAAIAPWRIGPADPVSPKSKAKSKRKTSKTRTAKENTEEKAGAFPSTSPAGSLYAAGTHDLAAGVKGRIVLREERWPADFLYIAKPRESQSAFLTAAVRLPAAIAAGDAVYMVDGQLTGKRAFAAGKGETVFFGTDPAVAVETALLPAAVSPASEKNQAVTPKDRRNWTRRIDVSNRSANPIKLRIEEPVPVPGDGRVTIALTCRPEPVERTPSSAVWLMDVPAGQTASVAIDIVVEAPAGLKLDMGW